jgi:hypothetical protein
VPSRQNRIVPFPPSEKFPPFFRLKVISNKEEDVDWAADRLLWSQRRVDVIREPDVILPYVYTVGTG